MAAIGLIALKAADHYDKHHMGGKFDDRGRNAEAISRYVEEYVKREKDS
jgi:hypothetical protein